MQFGARIEAGVHLGPVNAVGFIRLDALIQFVPFHFEVDFSAGFQIRWNALSFGSVTISGTISGPGPMTLNGKFHIDLLFWSIGWSDSWTLGSTPVAAPPPVTSVAQKMQAELSEPENLSADGGADPHAAVQLAGSPTLSVVSPIGTLVWTQHRAPLGVQLDRFEGQPLATAQKVAVTASVGTVPVQDWFSPGSYSSLTPAESLHQPSFERLDGGVAFGFGDESSEFVDHPYTVTQYRLPTPPAKRPPLAFPLVTLEAMLARDRPVAVRTRTAAFTVGEETYVVRGDDASVLQTATSQTEAFQQAKRMSGQAMSLHDVVELAGV